MSEETFLGRKKIKYLNIITELFNLKVASERVSDVSPHTEVSGGIVNVILWPSVALSVQSSSILLAGCGVESKPNTVWHTDSTSCFVHCTLSGFPPVFVWSLYRDWEVVGLEIV